MKQPKNGCGWLTPLLLLSVTLAGCATNSVTPMCELPQLPPPPSESTPQPQTSYSDSAASDTQSWQQELMGTPLMREPAAPRGQ